MSDEAAQRRRELTRVRMRHLRARRREAEQLSLFEELTRECPQSCGNRVTAVEIASQVSAHRSTRTLPTARGHARGVLVATGYQDHPLFIRDRENRKEGAPNERATTPPDGGEAFVRWFVRTATERLRPWQKYLDRSEDESRRRMLYAIDLELKAANLKVSKATIARAIRRERKAGRAS